MSMIVDGYGWGRIMTIDHDGDVAEQMRSVEQTLHEAVALVAAAVIDPRLRRHVDAAEVERMAHRLLDAACETRRRAA